MSSWRIRLSFPTDPRYDTLELVIDASGTHWAHIYRNISRGEKRIEHFTTRSDSRRERIKVVI